MRIEFDTGNALEVQAIAALIGVLGGRTPGEHVEIPTFEGPAFVKGVIESADDIDAAEAFAGGASAEQAFGGTAPLPPAAPATSPTSPPAGEAATAAASDTGQNATSGASPSSPPAGVDVDKHGLPHDGRIHSSPPKKNAGGSWRQKRGVDPALVEQVSGELRRLMAIPVAQGGAPAPDMAAALEQSRQHLGGGQEAAAPTPPAPPPAPATVPTPPAPPAPADTGVSSTAPAATAPAAPVAAPAASSAPVTFADLMRKITGLQSAGGLTVAETSQIAQSLGLTGVRDLITRPDMIPSFDALLPVAG